MKEELAALAHRQWSGWLEYMFSKCIANANGSVTIPVLQVGRWRRQTATSYEDLSEAEKESDRHQADKYLALLHAHLQFIVEQLKSCNYTCEAGSLENNVAFMSLSDMAVSSDIVCETIDGKWWVFVDGQVHRVLTDKEAASVIWGSRDGRK